MKKANNPKMKQKNNDLLFICTEQSFKMLISEFLYGIKWHNKLKFKCFDKKINLTFLKSIIKFQPTIDKDYYIMDSFQNISITLPQEKARDHIFYSTSKKWGKDHHTIGLDFTKDSLMKQLSCSSKNNKTVINFDLRAQTMKLQHKLNLKNELLIKQSKWKNYYFKEEIYVLTQDILEYLNLMSREISQNSLFCQYAKKLEKIIAKVQIKKKTQKNWIQLLGISSPQHTGTENESKTVQTQQAFNENSQSPNADLVQRKELVEIQQDNKKLMKNLNILTQQIENKHKEISHWQQKYSKLKLKRDKLKSEYIHLEAKLEEFVIKQLSRRQYLEKTQNFSRRKPHKNATHFHTYSWDKNQISGKSKFAVHSEENGQKIEEESSNLFILSDTPFIQEKNREIPISTGFIETRTKLEIKIDEVSRNKSKKSMSIVTNKSGEKTISIIDKKHSQKSQLSKKNKTQNEKIDSVEIDQGQLPTNSLIYESQTGQADTYRQLLLSQALTIQNLLERIQ